MMDQIVQWVRPGAPLPEGYRPAGERVTHHSRHAYLAVRDMSAAVVIGLTGLAGSGKSTVARHLAKVHGARIEKFAGPLKDMMRALGLTEAEIEGHAKESPCDLLCGATPRHAMQTIGTEWGRMLIHPDLWVRAWEKRVAGGGLIVADDCRFANEAAAIRRAGGVVVQVWRAGQSAGEHLSEQGIGQPDHILVNDSDVPALLGRVDRLMADILGADIPSAP